jgi:cobalt-zinc-cadmium efflux system outer membrane protein
VRIPFVLILFLHIPAAAAVAQAPASFMLLDSQPSSPQSATSGSGPVTPLSIVQALDLAEQNSPLLQEANASVDRARAGIQTAKAYTNPSFDFLGGRQSARPIPTPGVPGALLHYGASQTLEIPRERRTRIESSEFDLTSSEYRLAGIRLSVAAEVKRAFYDVIRRKEQLANAKDNLALVEDLRRRVRLEVEVGEKGRLELTRAEAELARAQAAIRSADIELANTRAILKAVIGSTSEETFDAEGSPGLAVQLPALADIRQQVIANHPAISEVNALTLRSRSMVEHERALRVPEPTFSGEYEHQPDITFYRFGVSVPLPLWNRRKGPIAEAQSEVNRSEASARQRRLEIVAALERAYDQYQISNQQVEGLQAGSLREAQAAVEAAQSAYKFGERGIVEVLDAQRVLQGVRSDLLDALFARQSALIDLEELGVTHQ